MIVLLCALPRRSLIKTSEYSSRRGQIVNHSFLLAALSLFLVPSAAQAEEWWFVIPDDPAGQTWMGDAESIESPIDAYTVYKGETVPREPGVKTAWFHKFLPEPDTDGMRSAMLQWRFDCDRRTWRLLKHIDYSASYEVIDSGELSHGVAPVEEAYVSGKLFNFVCKPPSFRKQNFTNIAPDKNYRGAGVFMNNAYALARKTSASTNSGTVVSERAPQSSPRTTNPAVARNAPEDVDAARKYQYCVFAAAKKFSSTNETAPVIAQSAVQNCVALRAKFYRSYSSTNSFANTRALFKLFDAKVLAEAQLIVVKTRSARGR